MTPPGFNDFMLEAFLQIKDIYRAADDILSRTVGEAEQVHGPSSCRACTGAWCCDSLVMVSAVEALYMTRGLGGTFWDSEEGARMLVDIGKDQQRKTPKTWFHLHRPCPLLKDKRCTIYPYRPLSCRRYYVWNQPDQCRTPGAGKIQELRVNEVLHYCDPRLLRLQKWLGWGPAFGPLPLVLGTVIQAMYTKEVAKMADMIQRANLRAAPHHNTPLKMFWVGVSPKELR